MPLILWTDETLALGIDTMDDTHKEFVDLINALAEAPAAAFQARFPELVAHTRAHFAAENALMERTGFPPTREHKDEHLRVLGELDRFAERVAQGHISLGRAYVRDRLPGWFALHAGTMDSALAAHLKHHSGTLAGDEVRAA